MMTKSSLLALSGLGLVLAGCASDQQLLANDQTNAVQAAVRRGQSELPCPGATGTMLSNTLLQLSIISISMCVRDSVPPE